MTDSEFHSLMFPLKGKWPQKPVELKRRRLATVKYRLHDVRGQQCESQHATEVGLVDFLRLGQLEDRGVSAAFEKLLPAEGPRAMALTNAVSTFARRRLGNPSGAMTSRRPPLLRTTKGTRTVMVVSTLSPTAVMLTITPRFVVVPRDLGERSPIHPL